jgi:hypothetical protein
MASVGSLNVTVGLQLAKLEADFRSMQSKFKDNQNSIKRETERSANDIGNEFTNILSRKFNSGEIFKGLLQGFGIGSATAITDKLINLGIEFVKKPFKELEEATKNAGKALDALDAAYKKARESAFNRLSPEAQQKDLLNQMRLEAINLENARRTIKQNKEEMESPSLNQFGVIGKKYAQTELSKNIQENLQQERLALAAMVDLQIKLEDVNDAIYKKKQNDKEKDKKTQEELIKNEEEMAQKEIELKSKLAQLAEEERQ